jgi:uncharacterized oxidoreductase
LAQPSLCVSTRSAIWWLLQGAIRGKLESAISGRGNMFALEYDAADSVSVALLCEHLIEGYPSLNVIVNCAGIMKFEQIDAKRNLADAEAEVTIIFWGQSG